MKMIIMLYHFKEKKIEYDEITGIPLPPSGTKYFIITKFRDNERPVVVAEYNTREEAEKRLNELRKNNRFTKFEMEEL